MKRKTNTPRNTGKTTADPSKNQAAAGVDDPVLQMRQRVAERPDIQAIRTVCDGSTPT